MSIPLNDNFADRIVLSSGVPVLGTTDEATFEANELVIGDGSVWYEVLATQNGTIKIEFYNTLFFGAYIIYTGSSLATLSMIDYAYVEVGTPSILYLEVTAGTSYKIQVVDYMTSGSFNVVVYQMEFPAPTAVISRLYTGFRLDLLRGLVDLLTDQINCAILNNTYVPDLLNHRTWDDVSAYEVSGDGYTSGGRTLAGKTVSITSSGASYLNASDLGFPGVTFTGAKYIVLYDVTNSNSLIGVIDFSSLAIPDPVDENFKIVWDNIVNAILEVV
jgi:hypothetical protein